MGDVEMRRLLRRPALEKTQYQAQVPNGRFEAKADRAAGKPHPPLANPSPGQPQVASGFVQEKCLASAQLHAWGCSRLQLEREFGGDEDHGFTGGADFAVHAALPVPKLAAEFVIRHNAHAHFV